MANYVSAMRTNYFRVTDEERYAEIFGDLTSEGGVLDFTKSVEGTVLHGFGSYGGIDYCPGYNDEEAWDEYGFDGFLLELQKILPGDEAFMCFEAGWEKLRYVVGVAVVCTADEIRSITLDSWAMLEARKLLGEGFDTESID